MKKIFFGILILWTAFIVIGFSTSPSAPGSLNALLIFGALPWLLVWAVYSYRWQRAQKSKRSLTDPDPSVAINSSVINYSPPAPTPPAPLTDQSSSAIGMGDDSYQGFRQLVKMALSDGVVEHDEAAYLYAYLRKEGGLQDSRTRHLAIVFAATLNDGIFDEEEAEEMRVLLSEFADADLFSLPQEKKAASSHKAHKGKAKKSKKEARPVLGDLMAGGTYDLTYCDADGNYSERRVHVREIAFNKSGNEIVKGRCYLAKATRSFRRDRILTAVDIETGEMCI